MASEEDEKSTGSADATDSRAPDADSAETVAERVAVIADMMSRLEWDSRKSARELAAKWNVALSTVRNYSSEAHRLCVADADECIRDVTVVCRDALRQAHQAADFQGIKAVATVWMDVSGARPAAKHELTGKDGSPLNGPVIYVPPESDD